MRKVEEAFHDGQYQLQRRVVGKAFYRISHADDIHAALERLYCVRGFSQFALRLMWLFARAGEDTSRLEDAVIDHDVEMLIDTLTPAGQAQDGGGGASPAVPPLPAQEMEAFYESLHRFGRAVGEMKRRAFEGDQFKGADEDSLYHVLSETGTLHEAARAVGKDDVVKFSTACTGFINYALEHGLTHDARVMNMLEHANLTLQTVLEATGTEEYDSLSKSAELLANPKELLS